MRFSSPVTAAGLAALLWTPGWSLGQERAPDVSQNTRISVVMPARFASNLIYVDLALLSEDTLSFFTDTGGGTFLFGHAADRVRWTDSTGVTLGNIAVNRTFPEPLGTEGKRLPIFRPEEESLAQFDGMLGQAWFADRVWTFDYESELLLLHGSAPGSEYGERVAELGFKTDSTGARLLSFPRISVVVDGDKLDMLLDTGARVDLTVGALSVLADGGTATRATSFITTEVMDRWLGRNPEWSVVEDADERVQGMRLIEVPTVQVAGMDVGPVRFTERPDANFHEFMSRFTDRRVDGALGGNVLRFFRVILDYPAAAARFIPVGR